MFKSIPLQCCGLKEFDCIIFNELIQNYVRDVMSVDPWLPELAPQILQRNDSFSLVANCHQQLVTKKEEGKFLLMSKKVLVFRVLGLRCE